MWNGATRSACANRIVHGYWSVDLEVLVATARDDLPAFIGRIRSADAEPPDQE